MIHVTLTGTVQLLLSINLLHSTVSSKVVFHHPISHATDNVAISIKRQAITSPVYTVLGVRGLGVDTTHPRLEIRELEQNKDQLNIYLLGLQRFQSTSQEDELSYYQVAGMSFLSHKDAFKQDKTLMECRHTWPTFHIMGWG